MVAMPNEALERDAAKSTYLAPSCVPKSLVRNHATNRSCAYNMNYVVKHLKRFVSAVAILAALILGVMCLTQQTDSQSTAPPLPNRDRGEPPPPGVVQEPCVEVALGVWRQEDPATGETRPCSPTFVSPKPTPSTLIEANRDRPGMDYRNFDLSEARPEVCQTACESDPKCKAYTYVKPGVQGRHARCWLKSGVPKVVINDCCISGVKKRNGS